jgi:hypothetical protein
MTDIEFDIIDELYFVTAFADLSGHLGLLDTELARHLQDLVVRGYVKCFYPDPDTEVLFEEATFAREHRQYYFLATKEGLVAHNSR